MKNEINTLRMTVTTIVLFILAFSSVLPANAVQQSEGAAIVSPVGVGVIHGTIFNDLNGDRVKEAGEPGLSNWTIWLVKYNITTRTILAKKSAITDVNGNYNFTNLSSGTYIVFEILKPKWVPTTLPFRTIVLKENENVVVDFGNRRR